MKQGRSISTNALAVNQNQPQTNYNINQILNQKENNENMFYQSNNMQQYPIQGFQKESNYFIDSSKKSIHQSPFMNSSGFQQTGLFIDPQQMQVLQNSSNNMHFRSQSILSQKKTNDTLIHQQNTTPKHRGKSQSKRQLSDMDIKKMNTLNFIQSLNESQRSNNSSLYLGGGQNMNSLQKPNHSVQSNLNESNMYTFSKLNEIRTQLREQKEQLEQKQQQRDALKSFCDREQEKFQQKINEINQMIIDEEEINQKQQIIIKEDPTQRFSAIKKVFINSEKLFESLSWVDELFSEQCRRNQNMSHYEEFKRVQMPILGSLEKLFNEKQNIILNIYNNQDQLENYSENRKMQQQDLEGYELRNIELALECDDLEAYIDMLKQNEDDCQIQQQINLRNVWMCLQNELHKLNQKIEEIQQVYNDLDNQSRAIEKEMEVEVQESKELLSQKESLITPKEKIEELTLKEFVKTYLNTIGKEAYDEIEYLYDGEKMGQIVCEESFQQEQEDKTMYQNKMMNLIKSFQQVLIEEFQCYSTKYNQLLYQGEQEVQFMNIKQQLLSNVKIDYQNSKCGQMFDKILDLNSLFSRITINCLRKEDVARIHSNIVGILRIKKLSFQENFEEQKIFSNLKFNTNKKNDELMEIQNEKLIVMAKLDQMKNRNKELIYEIEKQEQNTIPFFTTEHQSNNFNNDIYNNYQNNYNLTKRSNCDDSYIFDDTTGYLNKTKITQTNNQYLINALNDSHLNQTINTNYNNHSQINQISQLLNNSHNSYNVNNILKTTQTARTNYNNNQSVLDRSIARHLNTNPNNMSSRSLSPSPSTSKIQGVPPKKQQGEMKSQSAHYQAQYERKTQVDKIFIRMSEIKVQKDLNNKYIRELIAKAEKEYPNIEHIEQETKMYTTELLNINGLQKDHAEKLVQVYHHFFDDNIQNFIRKLEGYILLQQVVPLNEFTPALNFFFTRETLTPIAKLKLLQKKMEDLKMEQDKLMQSWVQQVREIEGEVIIITQRIHQIQLLYNKYEIPIDSNSSQLFYQQLSAGNVPMGSFQSSSSSNAFGGCAVNHDQSLNLSDIQGVGSTAQKHHKVNSSVMGMQQNQYFCNETSLLQQQFGSQVYNNNKQSGVYSSSSSNNLNAGNASRFDQNTTRMIGNNLSQKLKIHNSLLDESQGENIIKQFKEDQGVSLYKMFQVNQGNLIKSQIFDPLTQKKHPQMCGYGLRKLSINNDEVIFYNQKNQSVDLTIKIADFTNIFIHPVTIEIIKYQSMNSNNKQVQRNSVKKYLDACYYPFALEVKQTGRIECLCDNYLSLKLLYTLFVTVLTDRQSFGSSQIQ